MVNKEVQYHVFADNCDEWFETYVDEELDVENCLEATGVYPW